MKHKPKRGRLFFLYLALIAALGYSGWQLRSASAQDDEGIVIEGSAVCCSYSSDCGGSTVCYLPDKRAACCNPGDSTCAGANYCQAGP